MATTETTLDERTTEHGLVSGAGQGHTAAFDELYRRHAGAVWRLALAITRDADAAAVVVSETFAKAFTAVRAGRHATDAPFRPFLLVTARNASIDLGRSRTRDGDTDDASGDDRPSVDPADDTVAAAFGRLPERWRSVLWLAEVEGLRPRDIAPVVGLSVDDTAQLATRARGGLRTQYVQIAAAASTEHDCARTVKRLGAHVDGSMTEGDHDKTEAHLSSCPPCTARHAELRDLDRRLRWLALPLPALLIDDVRTAWADSVAVRATTTTGLSATTEKVLAGASAAAAVIGILGATLFGVDRARSDDQQTAASPIAPIVTEASAPQPDLDAGIDLVAEATRLSRSSGPGATNSLGGASLPVVSSPDAASGSDGSSDASAPGLVTAPAHAPGTAAPPATAESPEPGAVHVPLPSLIPPSDEPSSSLTVGTTVADVPIAVEVSDEPGATVGPVSVGSAPEPGDEPIETTEPAESDDPVTTTVETIGDVVDGSSSLLG